MVKIVKEICDNCGEIKEFTVKERIFHIIKTFLVILGVFFLAFLIVIGPVTLMNMAVTNIILYQARLDHDELRATAINMTWACGNDGGNLKCLERELFYALKDDARYVPDSLIKRQGYDLDRVLNEGVDCKYWAVTYTGLARSIGIDARMECEKKHCVSSIRRDDGSRLIVDMTIPAAYIVYEGESWDAIYELDQEWSRESEYWRRQVYW